MKRLTLTLLLIFVLNALLGGDARAYDYNTNAYQDTSTYGQYYNQSAQNSADDSTGQRQTDENRMREARCTMLQVWNNYTSRYEYKKVCN